MMWENKKGIYIFPSRPYKHHCKCNWHLKCLFVLESSTVIEITSTCINGKENSSPHRMQLSPDATASSVDMEEALDRLIIAAEK